MKPTSQPDNEAASARITRLIQDLQGQADWRGATLAHVRQLIQAADPDIQEEWKWVKESSPGTPVWSHDGGVCTGELYKQAVKLTFFRGASLNDPEKLFTQPGTRAACDRPARRRADQRGCLQGTDPCRRWRPTPPRWLNGQPGKSAKTSFRSLRAQKREDLPGQVDQRVTQPRDEH